MVLQVLLAGGAVALALAAAVLAVRRAVWPATGTQDNVQDNVQESWSTFIRRVQSPFGLWDALIVGVLWYVLGIAFLAFGPSLVFVLFGSSGSSSLIAALPASGAAAMTVVQIARRRLWPAQALVVWYLRAGIVRESAQADDPDRVGARTVGERALELISARRYSEARDLVPQMKPLVGQYARAMADIMETGAFDRAAFVAAVGELTDPDERRYWSARLAMTSAFADYRNGGDFRGTLALASKDLQPLPLSRKSRIVLWALRFGAPAIFLIVAALSLIAGIARGP